MAEAAAAAKKATSAKARSGVKKAISGTAKAAGAEVAGGGPEDPAADISALKGLASSGKKNGKTEGGNDEAAPAGKSTPAKKTAPAKSRKARAVSWAWSGDQRLLMAEFLLVLAIIGLGTLVTPGNVKDELHKMMVKLAATMALFFLLAVLSSSGKGAAKASTALATLITTAYVFTSPEAHQLVAWTGAFFAPPRHGK